MFNTTCEQVWIIFAVTSFAFVVALSAATKHRHQEPSEEPIERNKNFAEHLSDNFIYIITVIVGNGKFNYNDQWFIELNEC